MKVVVRSVVLLTLIFFAAHRQARAFDYCPQAFYGYMNNTYMYYCDYCDPTAGCMTCGVSVATMYACGGDYRCCSGAPDNCIDPIPASAVVFTAEVKGNAEAKKPAANDKKLTANPLVDPTRIPLMIGDQQQQTFVTASEKFLSPGPHITKDLDAIVKIPEPAGGWSYFRLLRVTYTEPSGDQHTIYMGMEMDPTKPPANVLLTAKRAKKIKGNGTFAHTITYKGNDFDASSKSDLPDNSN